jgi:hypothetical protein
LSILETLRKLRTPWGLGTWRLDWCLATGFALLSAWSLASYWQGVLSVILLILSLRGPKDIEFRKSFIYGVLAVSVLYSALVDLKAGDGPLWAWAAQWAALLGQYIVLCRRGSDRRYLAFTGTIVLIGLHFGQSPLAKEWIGIWAFWVISQQFSHFGWQRRLGAWFLWAMALALGFWSIQQSHRFQMHWLGGGAKTIGFSEEWRMGEFDSDALGPEALETVLWVKGLSEPTYFAGTRYAAYSNGTWKLLPQKQTIHNTGIWVEHRFYFHEKSLDFSCKRRPWIQPKVSMEWLFLPYASGGMALKADTVLTQRGGGYKSLNKSDMEGYFGCDLQQLDRSSPQDAELSIPAELRESVEDWWHIHPQSSSHAPAPVEAFDTHPEAASSSSTIQSKSNLYKNHEAVVQHVLRILQQGEYHLKPGLPLSNPLKEFLRQPRGFCEHYAGAAALLLRYQGIPTRLVRGFAGGLPVGDAEDSSWVLQRKDAHAWIEWYDPNLGWRVADATPAAAFAQEEQAPWWKEWELRKNTWIFAFKSAEWRMWISQIEDLRIMWVKEFEENPEFLVWILGILSTLMALIYARQRWILHKRHQSAQGAIFKVQDLLKNTDIQLPTESTVQEWIQALKAQKPNSKIAQAIELLESYQKTRWRI